MAAWLLIPLILIATIAIVYAMRALPDALKEHRRQRAMDEWENLQDHARFVRNLGEKAPGLLVMPPGSNVSNVQKPTVSLDAQQIIARMVNGDAEIPLEPLTPEEYVVK